MKAGYRKAVTIIVFLVIAAVIIWIYIFREPKLSVASKSPDFELQATELLAAFESNETEANKLYLGKIIRVSGMVSSVSKDSVGITVYLQEPDAVSGVICTFEKSTIDTTLVDEGKRIWVKGICTGYLMDVVLNRCALEQGPDHKEDIPQGSNFYNYFALLSDLFKDS